MVRFLALGLFVFSVCATAQSETRITMSIAQISNRYTHQMTIDQIQLQLESYLSREFECKSIQFTVQQTGRLVSIDGTAQCPATLDVWVDYSKEGFIEKTGVLTVTVNDRTHGVQLEPTKINLGF